MDQIEIIKKNIRAAIKSARNQGTVGMSLNNLFHVTETKGVTCPVKMYPILFRQAVESMATKFVYGMDEEIEIYGSPKCV